MTTTFRTVPANDRGYVGLTELSHGGRTYACMGTGPAVEAALVKRAKEARG